jgi:hypothetical protein
VNTLVESYGGQGYVSLTSAVTSAAAAALALIFEVGPATVGQKGPVAR